MNKRITYLDGYRGIAAVTVLISHFINCFLVYYIDVPKMKNYPFSVLVDGNVAVRYFFVLCGFTACYQLISNRGIIRIITKKYFRLAVPCLLINTIAFVIMNKDLYYNLSAVKVLNAASGHLATANCYVDNPLQIITESFILDIFLPIKDMGKMIVAPLWTMSYEMIGTIAVCIFFFCDKVFKAFLFYKDKVVYFDYCNICSY